MATGLQHCYGINKFIDQGMLCIILFCRKTESTAFVNLQFKKNEINQENKGDNFELKIVILRY